MRNRSIAGAGCGAYFVDQRHVRTAVKKPAGPDEGSNYGEADLGYQPGRTTSFDAVCRDKRNADRKADRGVDGREDEKPVELPAYSGHRYSQAHHRVGKETGREQPHDRIAIRRVLSAEEGPEERVARQDKEKHQRQKDGQYQDSGTATTLVLR